MRLLPTYLLLFATLLGTGVRAQNDSPDQNAAVSGRVLTDEGPAEFTNVLLLAAADSNVVKLELADEQGRFTFAELAAGDYFVRTTGIGLPQQNHPGFALAAGQELTLPDYTLSSAGTDLDVVEVTHRNLNDDTIEGIRIVGKPAFSVQYHPEASPGPHDAAYLFDQFVDLIRERGAVRP